MPQIMSIVIVQKSVLLWKTGLFGKKTTSSDFILRVNEERENVSGGAKK